MLCSFEIGLTVANITAEPFREEQLLTAFCMVNYGASASTFSVLLWEENKVFLNTSETNARTVGR